MPIPGTKRRSYLRENVGAVDVSLSAEELARLDTDLPRGSMAGERYSEPLMRMLDR